MTRHQAFAGLEMLSWALAPALLTYYASDLITYVLVAKYGAPENVPPTVASKLIFISPVFPLLLGVAAVLRLGWGRRRVGSVIGFSTAKLPADLRAGLGVALVSVLVAYLSLRLLSRFTSIPPFHLMPSSVHVYCMTVGAVIPGLCEELYYRGMLFEVGARLDPRFRVFTAALGFSLWHLSTPAYLPHTFLMGLLLGALVIKTGRVMPAIVAHSLANALLGGLLLAGVRLGA